MATSKDEHDGSVPDPRIDRDRGAVYRAEDQIARIMAQVHRRVRLGRGSVVLPSDPPMAGLVEMQAFVDEVLGDLGILGPPWSDQPDGPVVVRPARGFRRATYRAGIICIPTADPRGRWAMTRAVLLHELAHHLSGGTGHGPRFRSCLVRLYEAHLGGSAGELLAHLLRPLDELPDPDHRTDAGSDQVRRVAALLAKAQSTASAEESEAYLAKAALVAQRYSIDLAVAALAPAELGQAPTHRMLTIGRPRESLNPHLVALYAAIAGAWQVRVDIGQGSTYVLGYGMPTDLDQVESVFATASTLMVQRAREHVRSRSWAQSTYRPPAGGATRAVTATVARNAFFIGFIERIRVRMDEAARNARAQAERGRVEEATSPADGRVRGGGVPGPSVEVALRVREIAVRDYHRSTSQARGTWRGSATTSATESGSRLAGRRAADALGRQGISGSRPAIGA